jgi:glycosyltransferase involved in cell wall biosynthesis
MCNVKLPKISVVVPVLNAQKSLEKAICSVLDQDYENLELIVLDAGSTDGTLEIIEKYQSAIHYWHSKPDGSAYHAINLGIEQSTGELIAQLMADDWFEPNTFHKIAQAYLDNPTADLYSCGGRIVSFDENTQQYRALSSYTDKQQELNFYNVCFGMPAMSTRFLTRTLIAKVGLITPFDAQGKHVFSGDREYLLRVVVNQCKNVVVNHLGHTYLAHQGSATFGKNRQTALKIFQEHMIITKAYSSINGLSRQQRAVLRHWYNDQSVRCLLFQILDGDFGRACNTIIDGLKETKMYWFIALICVPCKIIARKIICFFARKEQQYI